jgi:thymidylate synthase
VEYLPYRKRRPDVQYKDALRFILENGELIKSTPQGIGAITSMEAPKLVYDLKNGFPMITERSVEKFWRAPINELFAFIRGVTTFSGLSNAGCSWWGQWKENAEKMGLPADNLGPASYGGAFANFPTPGGAGFNQFTHLVTEMRKYPDLRTHFISPWIPFMIGRDEGFKGAVVSPCHGWIHARVINGKLAVHMFQRSGDFPVGVPSNTIQYAAFTLALADLLGLEPWKFIHSFSDAHIYEDQIENVYEILSRRSLPFPTVRLNKKVTDLSEVDGSWFDIEEYESGPSMRIPVAT